METIDAVAVETIDAPAVETIDAPAVDTIDAPKETREVGASRTMRRNAAALGAGQVFTWTTTLAWTLIVPRLLGPDGMGMIVTGLSVAAMLQIVMGAGTALYVTREIVVSHERASRIVASATIARLMLLPVFAIAIVLWAHFAGYGARQNTVLYLCGIATAIILLGEPIGAYFLATERMHYTAVFEAINKASQGIAGIALALLGFGALGFGASWVITAVFVVVLGLRWVRRYLHIEWRTTRHDVAEIARGSAKYWTGGLFFTIYAWIDTAMLSLMTNPTVVAWYGVPMRLWGTFLIIPSLASSVFLPKLVAANERSRGELERVARGPIELAFVLSLPIATAIAVAAGPGMRLIYGASFAQAAPVLVILGLNLIPMYLNVMLGFVCIAANKVGTWNWLLAGATVFNPAVNAILIPYTQHRYGNGAIGAAIALALTEALIACGGVAIVGRRIIGLSTLRRFGRMAVASGGSWLVVELLSGLGPVVSLAAGFVALVALVILCGAITREERRWIRSFAEQSARRVTASLAGLSSRSRGGRLAGRIINRLTGAVPAPSSDGPAG